MWTLERVIYKIEGVRLPIAVTFRQVGLFLSAVAGMAVLSRIPIVVRLPATVRYVLAPSLITWYLTKQSLDGKPPHRWLLSLVRYWLGPQRLLNFRPRPPMPRRLRFTAAVLIRGNSDAVSDHLS
ncbi:MAG TPA: TcpE family conjugal transfer membrane protein [Symbiobacteriaceae bacterium]